MQFLGQHFLKNDQAIKRIIASLDIQPFDQAQDKPGETIIEIGPGKGALTLPMAENLQFTNNCHRKRWGISKGTQQKNSRFRIKKYKNN